MLLNCDAKIRPLNGHFNGRLGNDRSLRESRHSCASSKLGLPLNPILR